MLALELIRAFSICGLFLLMQRGGMDEAMRWWAVLPVVLIVGVTSYIARTESKR